MKAKQRRKKHILDRQNGFCYWCSKRIDLNATIDHLIPKSKGGTDHDANLCLCCMKCNQAKSNMTPEQFVKHVLSVLKRFMLSEGFQNVRRSNVQM